MISDIHANLVALRAVVEQIGSVDVLYCLGDLVGYGPEPNEVVEELQRLNPDIVLMGNHDHAVVTGDTSFFTTNAALAVEWTRRRISEANLQYLGSLKPSARETLADATIALYHGSPRDALNEYVFPGSPSFILKSLVETAQADIVLLGHTHMPLNENLDSKFLGNPGSVGQPRDGDPRASFGLLELSSTGVSFEVRRVQYNIDLVASRIVNSGLPAFLADRLYIGA